MSNGRRHGPRQTKRWDSIASFVQAFTSDTTAATGALPFTESETILRMLGEYVIKPTSAPTNGDAARMGVGIAVVSSDAFAVTAVPDPLAEPEYPWLYWADHPFFFNSTSTVDAVAGLSLHKTFDIRSMRKVSPRESLTMIVQYGDSTGAPPLTFINGQTRVLLGH